MGNDNEQNQTSIELENEEKITQKEFLDGCFGCSSLGCLPFAVVFFVLITKVF